MAWNLMFVKKQINNFLKIMHLIYLSRIPIYRKILQDHNFELIKWMSQLTRIMPRCQPWSTGWITDQVATSTFWGTWTFTDCQIGTNFIRLLALVGSSFTTNQDWDSAGNQYFGKSLSRRWSIYLIRQSSSLESTKNFDTRFWKLIFYVRTLRHPELKYYRWGVMDKWLCHRGFGK